VHRLALLLAACSGAVPRAPLSPPGPEALGGFWELADGSHVVMQVTLLGDKATVEAWATDTRQRLEVGAVTWDGRTLRATFTYPPTHTTTTSALALVNADRLEGEVTGPYTGHETWIRIAPSEARAPGPAGTPQTQP
jgi:hypothetical protein